MENKYSFCEEIKNEYKIEDLESMTLSYRIDGFLDACNIDLSGSLCEKLISVMRLPYVNKKLDTAEAKYNINFARNYDSNGKYFIIIGKYNDLDLLFKNYFDKDRNKMKINELPFEISLGKIFNDYAYLIEMKTIKGSQTRFTITKSKEGETLSNRFSFYVNVKDFNMILKIVKHFVNNPEIVFMTYNEVMNEKKVSFNNKDLGVLIKDDEKNIESVKKNVKR